MLNLLTEPVVSKKANSETYVIMIIGKKPFFFFLPNPKNLYLVLEAELTILECLVQISNSCDILYLQLGQKSRWRPVARIAPTLKLVTHSIGSIPSTTIALLIMGVFLIKSFLNT